MGLVWSLSSSVAPNSVDFRLRGLLLGPGLALDGPPLTIALFPLVLLGFWALLPVCVVVVLLAFTCGGAGTGVGGGMGISCRSRTSNALTHNERTISNDKNPRMSMISSLGRMSRYAEKLRNSRKRRAGISINVSCSGILDGGSHSSG